MDYLDDPQRGPFYAPIGGPFMAPIDSDTVEFDTAPAGVLAAKTVELSVETTAARRKDRGYPEPGPRRGGAKAAEKAARTRAEKKEPPKPAPVAAAEVPRPISAFSLLHVSDPEEFTRKQAARLGINTESPKQRTPRA